MIEMCGKSAGVKRIECINEFLSSRKLFSNDIAFNSAIRSHSQKVRCSWLLLPGFVACFHLRSAFSGPRSLNAVTEGSNA